MTSLFRNFSHLHHLSNSQEDIGKYTHMHVFPRYYIQEIREWMHHFSWQEFLKNIVLWGDLSPKNRLKWSHGCDRMVGGVERKGISRVWKKQRGESSRISHKHSGALIYTQGIPKETKQTSNGGNFWSRNFRISWENQWLFLPVHSFIHSIFLEPSLKWYRTGSSHIKVTRFHVQGALRSVQLLQHHHPALLHPHSIDPTHHPHSLHSVCLLIQGEAATKAWIFWPKLEILMVNVSVSIYIPPWKSTYHLKRNHFKTKIVFQRQFLRVYVSFRRSKEATYGIVLPVGHTCAWFQIIEMFTIPFSSTLATRHHSIFSCAIWRCFVLHFAGMTAHLPKMDCRANDMKGKKENMRWS